VVSRSETMCGNAFRETLFRVMPGASDRREKLEIRGVRSQTEFGNEERLTLTLKSTFQSHDRQGAVVETAP